MRNRPRLLHTLLACCLGFLGSLCRLPAASADTASLDTVLKRIEEANAAFKSIAARLTYTRAIPLLDEKQTCKGELKYIKPGRMKITMGAPRDEELYTDGKFWWIVSNRDKQVEQYQVAEDRKAAQEASFLEFAFGGKIDRLKEGYKITMVGEKAQDDDTLWTLQMDPKLQDGPSRFSKILLGISRKAGLPVSIVLFESDGEIEHHFQFTDLRTDADLKESDLRFEMPRGYALIRPEDARE